MNRANLLCCALILAAATACSSDGVGLPAPDTISGKLARDADLTSFRGALEGTDLEGLLAEPGEYTLFAPTNEALAALGTLPEGEALRRLLFYHVVDRAYSVEDLQTQAPLSLETVEGRLIEVAVGNDLLLNGETKLLGSEGATNGVIHAVDVVLDPEGAAYPDP